MIFQVEKPKQFESGSQAESDKPKFEVASPELQPITAPDQENPESKQEQGKALEKPSDVVEQDAASILVNDRSQAEEAKINAAEHAAYVNKVLDPYKSLEELGLDPAGLMDQANRMTPEQKI